MNRGIKKSLQALCLTLGILATQSFAASTANVQANATLASSCTISFGDFNFGTITPGQNVAGISNNLDMLCSNNLPFNMNITFSHGTSYMTGSKSSDQLHYLIFSFNTGAVYDGTTDTTLSVSGTGAHIIFPMTTYILNDSNKYVAPYITPDNYSDTAQVVITY